MDAVKMPVDYGKLVVEEAELDAVCTIQFLKGYGLQPPYDWLPKEFLLNVASAIRLCRWERSGIDLHLQAGLPSGRAAIESALISFIEPQVFSSSLREQICSIAYDKLAWQSRDILGTLIEINDTTEDELADALARIVWENRASLFNVQEQMR